MQSSGYHHGAVDATTKLPILALTLETIRHHRFPQCCGLPEIPTPLDPCDLEFALEFMRCVS